MSLWECVKFRVWKPPPHTFLGQGIPHLHWDLNLRKSEDISGIINEDKTEVLKWNCSLVCRTPSAEVTSPRVPGGGGVKLRHRPVSPLGGERERECISVEPNKVLLCRVIRLNLWSGCIRECPMCGFQKYFETQHWKNAKYKMCMWLQWGVQLVNIYQLKCFPKQIITYSESSYSITACLLLVQLFNQPRLLGPISGS